MPPGFVPALLRIGLLEWALALLAVAVAGLSMWAWFHWKERHDGDVGLTTRVSNAFTHTLATGLGSALVLAPRELIWPAPVWPLVLGFGVLPVLVVATLWGVFRWRPLPEEHPMEPYTGLWTLLAAAIGHVVGRLVFWQV